MVFSGMSQKASRQPDCETLRALIPAYSVGATDPEETALVEQLLPLCPEGAAELDEYLALSQAMLYSAPAAKPPAHLHDKLMAAINAPAASSAAPESMTVRPLPIAVPRPTPVATAFPSRPKPAPRVLPFRLAAGLAAIAAALLIVSNVYWVNQVTGLRDQQQELTGLLHDQTNALASLGTGRANRLELVSTSETQKDTLATVLWNPQSKTALLYSDSLPQLPPDQAYEVWLIRDSTPVGVGMFQIDEQGVGVLIIQSDAPVEDFAVVAITAEPAAGSEQPTTKPVAVAQI